MEITAVVEAGERIQVGECAGLSKTVCVLDRGTSVAGELFELEHVILAERVRARARVDGEVAELAGAARQRHREARVDRGALGELSETEILVPNEHRANGAAVRRPDSLSLLGLVLGEPDRAHDRRWSERVQCDERRVDPRERDSGVESARENLVEVQRHGEIRQFASAAAFLLGAFERLCEVIHHRVHPLVQLGDGRDNTVVGTPSGVAARDHRAKHDEDADRCEQRDRDQRDRHIGCPCRSHRPRRSRWNRPSWRTVVPSTPPGYDLQPIRLPPRRYGRFWYHRRSGRQGHRLCRLSACETTDSGVMCRP